MKMKDKKDSVFSLISHHRELPLVLILVLLLIVVSALVPGYLKASYMNILKGGSIDLVMACGMLCVLLIGSIDISVAGVLAFSGALAGMLMRDGTIHSVFGMLVVGIGVGAVFGAVSGVLTAYGRVLPIIVTLGMSYVARALIPMEWLLGLNKIAPTDLTESFRGFFLDRSFLGLPYLVWTAIFGRGHHMAVPALYTYGAQAVCRRLQRSGGAGARREHPRRQGSGAHHLRRRGGTGRHSMAGVLQRH